MKSYTNLLALLLLSLSLSAQAKVRAHCDCKHARSNQVFPLTVDFVSGGELAKLTKDNRFHPTGAYAVVWLGKGKNTIVKFEGTYFSNPVTDSEVSTKSFQGTDFQGIGWQLKPTVLSDTMLDGKALSSYEGKGKKRQATRARAIGETYPNGQLVQKLNKYFYPNGQELNDQASFYYPNGKTRSIQGRDYYPNGQQVSSQGQFFYPNGRRLTVSASAGQNVQYLNDQGRKLSRAPSQVTMKDGKWTYYFQIYNGQVITDSFQADLRSPEGTINLQISGVEILRATIR